MKRAVVPADRGTEGVMIRAQRFRRDAVLDRDVDRGEFARGRLRVAVVVEHVAIHRDVFIETPRSGNVIHDDVADGIAAERIVTVSRIGIAATESQVANDDIVCLDLDRLVGEAHAIAGRSGTIDRDVRRANADALLEVNDAGDVEDDDAWAGRFDGLAERARAAVVERGDDVDFSAATAEGIHAAAPRAGKGRDARLREVARLRCAGQIRFPLRGPRGELGLMRRENFVGSAVGRGLAGIHRGLKIGRDFGIALGKSRGETQNKNQAKG